MGGWVGREGHGGASTTNLLMLWKDLMNHIMKA